jgi:hypothetical protein
MHHTLTAALARSRECELRAVVRRPDRLMARALQLQAETPPGRATHHS